MDALVRAPLLPAADVALVPAAYTARRVERDSANIPGTIKPDTAHVTVLSRSEFAAAQQKIKNSSELLHGCDGSDGPEEQLLARLRPLLLDVPEPLGFGGVVKYSMPFVGSASSSFRNNPYGTSSSGGVDVASDHSASFVCAEAYFVAVCWPSGQALRCACGLPPKDFHATLGFGPSGDVHDVPKGVGSLLKPRPWRELLTLAKSYIDAAAAITSNDETNDSSNGAATSMKPHAKKALPVSTYATYRLEAAVSASSAALMALHLDASSDTSGGSGISSSVDSANHDSSSSCSIEEISDKKMAGARAKAAVLAARSSALLQLGDYSRAAADAEEGLPLLDPPQESGDSSEDKPEAQDDDVGLHNTLESLLLTAATASPPPSAPMSLPPAPSSLPSSSFSSSSLPPAPPAALLSSPVLPKVPITRIFMDLDGVLADFDGGVRALTGKGPSDLSSREMV